MVWLHDDHQENIRPTPRALAGVRSSGMRSAAAISPDAVIHLQRAAGNRAVSAVILKRSLANSSSNAVERRCHEETQPGVGGEEELPKDREGPMAESDAASSGQLSEIRTILRRGEAPETRQGTAPWEGAPDSTAHGIVAPGGPPTVDNAAAASDCIPSTASAVLNWDPQPADAANWRANVVSLTLAGKVNVAPWPSQPNSMVVPNTPNPVDGGNINNVAGSSNHWQAAMNDMADYNAPGGGAGPRWHSTAASSAHEWAHWNTDYVKDSVSSAAGGNWPQANADIDALRVPKATSPTEAAARSALQARINTRLDTWRSRTIDRWNAIPDSPGAAGSTGYEAGMKVLAGHIKAVLGYSTSKGWP